MLNQLGLNRFIFISVILIISSILLITVKDAIGQFALLGIDWFTIVIVSMFGLGLWWISRPDTNGKYNVHAVASKVTIIAFFIGIFGVFKINEVITRPEPRLRLLYGAAICTPNNEFSIHLRFVNRGNGAAFDPEIRIAFDKLPKANGIATLSLFDGQNSELIREKMNFDEFEKIPKKEIELRFNLSPGESIGTYPTIYYNTDAKQSYWGLLPIKPNDYRSVIITYNFDDYIKKGIKEHRKEICEIENIKSGIFGDCVKRKIFPNEAEVYIKDKASNCKSNQLKIKFNGKIIRYPK